VSETGSTNEDLLAAATAGAENGSVFVADHQRAGRGRRDRSWVTAPGDALLVSVLLDFDDAEEAAALATTLIATCAVEALHGLGYDTVRIKWPNDLVVGEPGRHRKLAGILAQAATVDGRVRVVIGMGLNLRGARLDAEGAVALDQLERSVDAVEDPAHLPGADEVLVAVLEHFDRWWRRLGEPNGRESLRAAWLAESATVGTRVRADLDDRVVTGLAASVTADGALVIEPDDGGDVLVIRTADVVSLRPVV
jgi:BirA family biotin operon repressor/biotin-[acetyl-CoA-carboxylase] ligase